MPSPRVAPFEPEHIWQRACEPIFWLDPALKLTWVNRAWEKLTGHPAESVIGLTCQAHGPTGAGDLTDLAASFYPPPEALTGQPTGTRALIIHSAGGAIWRRIEFWPVLDENDLLIGLLGWVRSPEGEPSFPDARANQLHVELLEVRRQLRKQSGFDSLIGFGPSHRRLLDQARLAAASTTPVLIVGEPGTGKRQVARAIHKNGSGRQQPLIPFDCESLPAEILERELFGIERLALPDGAMTESTAGAGRPRLSLLEGSTLLIREITMLARDLQARLVAALDARVRLLATTAFDPESAFQGEKLQPELYFALTTMVLRLAPLRERSDELPVLAQHLLERANQRGGEQRTGFSPEAIAALMAYDWPGNLREMARVIDHARAGPGGDGQLITASDLPASIRGNLGGGFPPQSTDFHQTARRAAEPSRAAVDRNRVEPVTRQQVARRRSAGNLSTPSLSPHQRARPPRR